MRALNRTLLAAWALAGVLVAAAPPARAAIEQISTDDDQLLTRTYVGGATDLPVRPTLLWRDAVAWARTMPAVQSAMQTFAERGYVAVPEQDSAASSIDPPATYVVLNYVKPGLDLPRTAARPLIVVATRLDREGVPATVVTAGLLLADRGHQTVVSADSVASLAATDGSFDVAIAGGGVGGGDPGDRRLGAALIPPPWKMDSPKFNKFIVCFTMMSSPCLFQLWQDLPPSGDPYTTRVKEGWAILRFFLCELTVAFQCVNDVMPEGR